MRKIEGGPLGGGAGEVKAGVVGPRHLRRIMAGIEARLANVRRIRLRPAPYRRRGEQTKKRHDSTSQIGTIRTERKGRHEADEENSPGTAPLGRKLRTAPNLRVVRLPNENARKIQQAKYQRYRIVHAIKLPGNFRPCMPNICHKQPRAPRQSREPQHDTFEQHPNAFPINHPGRLAHPYRSGNPTPGSRPACVPTPARGSRSHRGRRISAPKESSP